MIAGDLSMHDIVYAFNYNSTEEAFFIWADLRGIDIYDAEHMYTASWLFKQAMPQLFRVNGSLSLHECFMYRQTNKWFVLPLSVDEVQEYISASTLDRCGNKLHSELFSVDHDTESKIFAFKCLMRFLGEDCYRGYC